MMLIEQLETLALRMPHFSQATGLEVKSCNLPSAQGAHGTPYAGMLSARSQAPGLVFVRETLVYKDESFSFPGIGKLELGNKRKQ